MGDLRRAAELFDGPDPTLRAAARSVRGFRGGGEWMRIALRALRGGDVPVGSPPFGRLGVIKYGAAAVAAAVAMAACARLGVWPAGFAVGPLAFYAVEAQMVFLFPIALDGDRRPFVAARRLTVRAGGTVAVVRRVLPIASYMLLGGLGGRGFRRCWCVGCLAVCAWYERVRQQSPAAPPRVILAPPKNPLRGRWALLEVGATRPLLVRRERVEGFGLSSPTRLLYASDLHLGRRWNGRVPEQVLAAAASAEPHIVVLGGDLADVPAGLAPLAELVRGLTARSPVFAVAGNHDRRLGISLVRQAVERGGGGWLLCAAVPNGVSLSASNDADVLCGHDPAVFRSAAASGVRLVLAGHLHGGQCVLRSLPDGRLWPGCWVNRWTGLRFQSGACAMLVSRGCADTLPLRWNCRREVLLCELT